MNTAIHRDKRSNRFHQRCGDARGAAKGAQLYAMADIRKDTRRGSIYIYQEHRVFTLCAMPERIVPLAMIADMVDFDFWHDPTDVL